MLAMNSEDDLSDDEIVYTYEEWNAYHLNLGCCLAGGFDKGFENIERITKKEAKKEGYDACNSCVNSPWLGKESEIQKMRNEGDKS